MVGKNNIYRNSHWDHLSWNNLLVNLYKVQNRLFKAVYVSDLGKALAFQKLILSSSLARLLAVREVTQLDSKRKLPGVDGIVYLSFTDRFELCQYLKSNVYNWQPSLSKSSIVVNKNGDFIPLNISTIRDRSWHCLIKFCLEPSHEATFSFRSFGCRVCIPVYYVQRLFFYNLNRHAFGLQKRIMIVDLKSFFSNFDFSSLINKLIITRSIKLGIFRSLNLGFKVDFTTDSFGFPDLSSLLSNIILNGVESLHPSIRYANQIVFFLKPLDNEIVLCKKISAFFSRNGCSNILPDFLLSSSLSGFDFLGWKFRVNMEGDVICFPSFNSYQQFLLRIKHILNNSNYGAV